VRLIIMGQLRNVCMCVYMCECVSMEPRCGERGVHWQRAPTAIKVRKEATFRHRKTTLHSHPRQEVPAVPSVV